MPYDVTRDTIGIADITSEFDHYERFFRGKTILCAMDGGAESDFIKYFLGKFKQFRLKALIGVKYNPFGFGTRIDYTLDPSGNIRDFTIELEDDGHILGNSMKSEIMDADIIIAPLKAGDTTKAVNLAKGKSFIYASGYYGIRTKELVQMFAEGDVRLGYGFKNDVVFYNNGRRVNKVVWLTNLPMYEQRKSTPVTVQPDKFEYYDTYGAININKCADIPVGYMGEIGCPQSILSRMPEGYKVTGALNSPTVVGRGKVSYRVLIQRAI